MTTTVSQEYLRRPEAAAFIGMSVAWLKKVERLGKGPERTRCGKIPIYHIEALRRFMASRIEQTSTNGSRAVTRKDPEKDTTKR